MFRNVLSNQKTQNNDLFISPKRKNTSLEMALKSFILSKLYHQMSKSWKRIVAHKLQTMYMGVLILFSTIYESYYTGDHTKWIRTKLGPLY